VIFSPFFTEITYRASTWLAGCCVCIQHKDYIYDVVWLAVSGIYSSVTSCNRNLVQRA